MENSCSKFDLERIRKAHAICQTLRHTVALKKRMDSAVLLRELGRPDIALSLSSESSLESTSEWIEHIKNIAACGDRLRLRSELKEVRIIKHCCIKSQQALQDDHDCLSDSDIRELSRCNKGFISSSDLRRRLSREARENLPINILVGLVQGSDIVRLRSKYLLYLSRLGRGSAAIASRVLFRYIEWWIGKIIIFIELNNFTKLACIVDRLDPILREIAANRRQRKVFVLFHGGYPNSELISLYSEHCTFVCTKGRLGRMLPSLVIEISKCGGWFVRNTVDYRVIKSDFQRYPSIFSFTSDRVTELAHKSAELGINIKRPLVCIGIRDMAYYGFYKQIIGSDVRSNSRDRTWHRCPPDDAYLDLARYLVTIGYQVVRMGLRVSSEWPRDISQDIIDYACMKRSDAFDIFLFSQCDFLVAGDTGLFSGAAAFDKPNILSDLFLIRNGMYSSCKSVKSRFIPKLFVDKKSNRILRFDEQIYYNHLFNYADNCADVGFGIIHNTSEDLIEACKELIADINSPKAV